MSHPFRFPLVSLLASAAVVALPTKRSDPVGVFALVDRVVIEGDTANPAAIQVWGVFALTTGGAGYDYKPAQRGYLYYSVNSQNRRATLAEWSDLKAMAGTGQVIGWGGRYVTPGRVRSAAESPSMPDIYPLGVGVAKMQALPIYGDAGKRPSIETDLAAVPLLMSPAEGTSVPAGTVRLAVRNVSLPNVQYMFELTPSGASVVSSPPVAPGQGQTSWAPSSPLRAGTTYTWRAWVTSGNWHGQSATGSFRVR